MKTRSLLLLAFAFITSLNAAPDLSQLKLQGRWPVSTNPVGANQGYAVALSDKWAISGAPFATPGTVVEEGAVHVFSAATGAWVRMLRRPAVDIGHQHFGQALAISGDLAVICDDGNIVNGTHAYVYNLATGALVRTLVPSYLNSGVSFGACVTISGNRVLIGSPEKSSGAVYLFDLVTGIQQTQFFGSDAGAFPSMQFGTSVAIDGNLALIGAPAHGAGRGAAYLLDLTTSTELAIIVPLASDAAGGVGNSVALSQGIAIMAAPYFGGTKGAVFTYDVRTHAQLTFGTNTANDYFGFSRPGAGVVASLGMLAVGSSYAAAGTGTVHVYDLQTGILLRTITATDGAGVGYFGSALAMNANTLIVGRSGDASPVSAVGSAYLFKPLTTVMPLTKVAARGDSAPGAPEAAFYVMGDAFMNSQGEVAFNAKLSGAGSHASTDTGVWTTMRAGGTLSLSAKSYTANASYTVLSVGTPIINNASMAYYPATLKTGIGGFTTLNNKPIYTETGSGSGFDTANGDSFSVFANAKLNSVTELVQSSGSASNNWAASCALRLEAATSTTAANDSAILIASSGLTYDGVREGAFIKPANLVKYGQFTGRIAHLIDSVIYSAATTEVKKNAVIMQKVFGAGETVVATKGAQSPPFNGPVFSAFIGEVADYYERVTYRASVTGLSVTSANNEGLWTRTKVGVDGVAMRKGTNAQLLGGLTIAKIIQFWAVSGIGDQVVALVQLGGTGVSSANDQALILVQEDNTWNILLREGQAAPSCHPATIGVISRVEMDPYNGYYAVLTTLAGAPVGTEQALFTGGLGFGNTGINATLRRPVLYLRKGALYDNQPSKIKSLSLPTTNITASGAGGTGRGRGVSQNAGIVITVEFDNGVRQIMKGSL